MSRVILLDSGPLGMVTNPKASSVEVEECKLWLKSLLLSGEMVIATTNVGHLSQFVDAREWRMIQ